MSPRARARTAPAQKSSYRFPRYTEGTAGPCTGVLDGYSPFNAAPDKAQTIVNGWVQTPETGSGVRNRPGFYALNALSPLPVTSNLFAIIEFELPSPPTLIGSGNFAIYVIVNGRLLQLNPVGPNSFNASFTDVTPSNVTIAPNGAAGQSNDILRIAWCQIGNTLIVTDGANQPWAWIPGSPTATLINLDSTGIPANQVAYGPPTVYYGAVFFVLSANRSTIVWSQPGQPTVGYNQTNYSNFWNLFQTSTDPITCLVGQNDALYYFRGHSIGAISGQVIENFSTTGTHDAISATVGSYNPASVIAVDNDIYFADAEGRPYIMKRGWGVYPIYEAALNTLQSTLGFAASVPFPALGGGIGTNAPAGVGFVGGGPAAMSAAYDASTHCVMWTVPPVGLSGPNQLLVFDTRGSNSFPPAPQFLGLWKPSSFQVPASLGNFLFFAKIARSKVNNALMWLDQNGVLYVSQSQAVDTGVDWTVIKSGVVSPTFIELQVEFSPTLYDAKEEKLFDLLDFVLTGQSNVQQTFVVDYTTNRGTSIGQQVSAQPSATTNDLHVRVGTSGTGRDIRPRITVSQGFANPQSSLANFPLSIIHCVVSAWVTDQNPTSP
jgi:hypothetical protein